MSRVAEKVQTIVCELLGVSPSKVVPQASFTADLGADSLETAELVMACEEEFGIEFPDQIDTLATVGALVGYIEKACPSSR